MRKPLASLLKSAERLREHERGGRAGSELERAYVNLCFTFYRVQLAFGVPEDTARAELMAELKAWSPGHLGGSVVCPPAVCTDCYACLQECLRALPSGSSATTCQDSYNQWVDQYC